MAAVQAVAVTDAPGVSEAELKDLLSSSASSVFRRRLLSLFGILELLGMRLNRIHQLLQRLL